MKLKKLILIALVACNLSCSEDEVPEEKLPPPVACFNVPTGTLYNEPIQFTNCSENAETYEWDFNGEGSSTEEEPVFQFETDGTKFIRLTVTQGDLKATKNISIKIEPYPGITFPAPDTDAHWPYAIHATNDNGYVVKLGMRTGSHDSPEWGNVMIKFDESFEEQWRYTLQNFSPLDHHTFLNLADGSYVTTFDGSLAGSPQAFEYVISAEGTRISERASYPSAFSNYTLLDDTPVYAGFRGAWEEYDDQRLAVFFPAPDGLFIVKYEHQQPDTISRAFDIDLVEDGYVVFGICRPKNASDAKMILVKLDLDFQPVWTLIHPLQLVDYNYSSASVRDWEMESVDDGFLLFTFPSVTKVNMQGEIEWSKKLPASDGFVGLGDVFRAGDNYVVLQGSVVSMIDANANVIWQATRNEDLTYVNGTVANDHLVLLRSQKISVPFGGATLANTRMNIEKLKFNGGSVSIAE